MILAINKRTENLVVEGSSMSARRVTRRLRLLYRVIIEAEGTADASTVAGGDFPPSSKRIKGDRTDPESRVIESRLLARRRLDRYASRCYRASR